MSVALAKLTESTSTAGDLFSAAIWFVGDSPVILMDEWVYRLQGDFMYPDLQLLFLAFVFEAIFTIITMCILILTVYFRDVRS